jgi:hypothetical protein
VEVDDKWFPSLVCIINDAIKYNDSLRNSQTVRDVEDIEEWLMSIYQFKDYLSEELSNHPEVYKKCEKYLDES